MTKQIKQARLMLEQDANAKLESLVKAKHFNIGGSSSPCTGNGSGGTVGNLVDLVVLIDTSGSMGKEAKAITQAADEAIKNAQKNCGVKLETHWLGVGGVWSGTNFSKTLEDYLVNDMSIPKADLAHNSSEDGALAIKDVVEYFKWRKGACRAIFYLSDEALENGDPHDAADVAAANAAITAAQSANVHLFMYYGDQNNAWTPAVKAEYQRVASETNGAYFEHPFSSIGGFAALFEEIICNSCGVVNCDPVKLPDLSPCFSLYWGDGPSDQIETHDTEIVYLRVCNNHTNIGLGNIKILSLELEMADGSAIPTLPDGTPSVRIVPSNFICFDYLEPCSCASRELTMLTCGAYEGSYRIKITYCCETVYLTPSGLKEDSFEFSLVKS